MRGSGLCRAIGYEAELPFAGFVNCHCSRCRKATGSAFGANAYVLPDAFRWTRGEAFKCERNFAIYFRPRRAPDASSKEFRLS